MFPDFGADGGQWVDAACHGIYIHHRASAEDGIVIVLPYFVKSGESVLFITSGTVIFVKFQCLDKVVAHTGALFG